MLCFALYMTASMGIFLCFRYLNAVFCPVHDGQDGYIPLFQVSMLCFALYMTARMGIFLCFRYLHVVFCPVHDGQDGYIPLFQVSPCCVLPCT